MKFNKYSPKEIIDLIEKLNKIKKNLRKDSIYELYSIFKDLRFSLPAVKIIPGDVIFRIRQNEGFGAIKLFSNKSEISYNKQGSKFFGRCNLPFNPTFYGSTQFETAFFETIKEEKIQSSKPLFFTVGHWVVKKPFWVNLVSEILETTDHPNQEFSSFSEHIKKIASEYDKNSAYLWNNFMKIVFNEFTEVINEDEIGYFLTSCYSKSVFESIGYIDTCLELVSMDGLLYLSTRHSNEGLNIAIHPKLVDNNYIELIEVEIKSIKIRENDVIIGDYLNSQRIDENGNIFY